MTIDLLPTIAGLIGAQLPSHPIDGLDIWPLIIADASAKSPHDALYFYWREELQAVRSGKWKLHFPHTYRTLSGRQGGTGGQPVKYDEDKTDWALFDLEKDIGETNDVAADNPEIVRRLQGMGEDFHKDLQQTSRAHDLVSQ
jgi:arylsulfatase A